MNARTAVAIAIALSLAGVLAWQLVQPWRRARRRRQWQATPLPDAWRAIALRNVALYARLPPDLRARVDGFMQVFLHEKRFVGCNGLTVTDEMRVTVAAQACILVVGRGVSCYDDLRQVLIYPRAFYVEHEEVYEDGVVAQERKILTGESWDTGQVIVSWDDARAGGRDGADGGNVVLHEFAHQLDAELGLVDADHTPTGDDPYSVWAQTLMDEYEALEDAVARGEPTLIDPYGAEHPAEFFAVATEVFFERAGELRARHPNLYQRLREVYHVDPALWGGTAAGAAAAVGLD